MASTDTPVGSVAALLQAVQAQTDTVKNFKDEQINVFTTSSPTATITDADGNAVVIPSWNAIVEEAHPSPTPAPSPGSGAVPPGLVQSLPNQANSFLMPMAFVPYGFRDQMLVDARDYTRDATVDSTGAVVSSSLTATQITQNTTNVPTGALPIRSLFKMGGRVPAYGKWFFSVQVPLPQAVGTTTDVSGNTITTYPASNSAELNIALNPSQYLANNYYDLPTSAQEGLSDTLGQLQILANLLFTGVALSINGGLTVGLGELGTATPTNFGSDNVAWTANPYNVLVCLDVDDSTITVYNATGQIGSIQVPLGWNGVSLLAGAYITGAIYPVTSNVSVTFNTTASLSPYAVPTGFNSLVEAIAWDELSNSDLQDHVEFSNPFFSHIWMGPNGELLGGISAASGQPWFMRGGFIAQDVAVLKNAVGYFNLPEMDYNGFSKTEEYWSTATSQRLLTTGGYQTQRMAVASSTVDNFSAGTRASDGGFEVYGLDVAKFMVEQLSEDTPLYDWFVVGDEMVLGAFMPVGYTPQWTKTYIYSGLKSTDYATAVGAVGMMLQLQNKTVVGGAGFQSQLHQPAAKGQWAWNMAPQSVVTGIWGLTAAGAPAALTPTYDAAAAVAAGYVSNSKTGQYNTAIYGWLGGIGTGTYGALYRDTVSTDANYNQTVFQPYYLTTANIPINDYVPFVVDTNPVLAPPVSVAGIGGSTYADSVVIMSVGRNNLNDLPTVQRDITAMVNALNGTDKMFIIVTPINMPNETSSTSNGQAVIALEQWITFMYPNNCFVTRQFLQGLGIAGSDTTTAITNGTTPVSVWNTDTSGNYTTLTLTMLGNIGSAVKNLVKARNWQAAPTLTPVHGSFV